MWLGGMDSGEVIEWAGQLLGQNDKLRNYICIHTDMPGKFIGVANTHNYPSAVTSPNRSPVTPVTPVTTN